MTPVPEYIDSLDSFQKIIDDAQRRRIISIANGLPLRQEFYRGQADSSWKIIPSLARGLHSAHQVKCVEQMVMDLFKKEVSIHGSHYRISLPSYKKEFTDDWYWLFQAQHYGVPTRLLDWTLRDIVALWFAVSDPAKDNTNGQFLILYYPNYETKIDGDDPSRDYHLVSPDKVNGLWMMNPAFHFDDSHIHKIAERRRARQYGKFVIQPYSDSFVGLDEMSPLLESWLDTATYNVPVLESYTIPAASKAQIRKELEARGITEESMYVEIDPVVEYIRKTCCNAVESFKQKCTPLPHC